MRRPIFALALILWAAPVCAAEPSDLANKLSNPISDLISFPFQFNYDCCFGPVDGERFTLNVQPVVPIKLNPDWTMIVRTIVPIIGQQEPVAGAGDAFGFGDTTQSYFFSPTPKPGGVIWGFGPAFLWPTATSPDIGSGKWGIGPTLIVLKQVKGWTYGILTNQIWSYAGENDHADVSALFLQPFIAHNWPDTTGVSLNSESSYNWYTEEWTVPINLMVSHIFKIGPHPVSFQMGARYYPVTPHDGPRWGLRFVITPLFPT